VVVAAERDILRTNAIVPAASCAEICKLHDALLVLQARCEQTAGQCAQFTGWR
jgi:hypothetical protein